MTDYRKEARSDAADTVRNFSDDILEKLIHFGEASSDLHNDYSDGDSYHHESHVDRCYPLLAAATLLDQLSEFEETDSGLWEGQEPREAVATQAAYTYGCAVLEYWRELISDINTEAESILAEYENKLEAERDRLVDRIDAAKDEIADLEADGREESEAAGQVDALEIEIGDLTSELDSLDDDNQAALREALAKKIEELCEQF